MKKIVQEGATVLQQKAKPVAKKDFGSAKLRKLLKDMSDALSKEPHGVALAAPQIGASLRVFIASGKVLMREAKNEGPNEGVETQEQEKDIIFINPEIVRASRKKVRLHEGCLSVRDKEGKSVFGFVERSERATVKAYDAQGKSFTYHGSGLMAQIFQHEIDHLDGTLFINKAEDLETEGSK